MNVFLGFADVVLRQSSVQQRHGQIAVHVPAAERGDGGAGQLVLVAAAEMAHLQVARLVVVRYFDVSRRQRRRGGRHGHRRHGLQVAEEPLLARVQDLSAGHALSFLGRHLVADPLPELGFELVAFGAVPLDERQHSDGVLEVLHLLVVDDAAQVRAFDHDHLDFARHQHAVQPRLELEDAPAAAGHELGGQDDDETPALLHAARQILDVCWGHTERERDK